MKKLLDVIVTVVVIAGMLSAAAAAEIHFEKEIGQLPATITDIYNCGHWVRVKDEGYFRVIYIDYFNGCSLLYVQWVKDFTPSNPTRHIVHTLSIKEFNANDHIELSFAKPTCKNSSDGIAFDIEAKSGQDGKRHLFSLQINQEYGKYTIKEKE